MKKKSEMKMTPEEFYIKSQGLTEKENAPIVFYRTDDLWALMQAYAEHCEESEWVSVDERLPRIGESVFVLRKDNEVKMDEFGVWDRSSQKFVSGWQNTQEGFITHWRPLPKPPKQ